jgi:hypothetical protein
VLNTSLITDPVKENHLVSQYTNLFATVKLVASFISAHEVSVNCSNLQNCDLLTDKEAYNGSEEGCSGPPQDTGLTFD